MLTHEHALSFNCIYDSRLNGYASSESYTRSFTTKLSRVIKMCLLPGIFKCIHEWIAECTSESDELSEGITMV